MKRRAIAVLLASLCIQGCGTSNSQTSAASDPCDQTPVFNGKETVDQYKAACPSWRKYANPTYPTTPASASNSGGRGILGSTDAEWNAVHTQDPNAMDGVAYDPSPGSYPDGADRFVALNHNAGRVTNLDENLPAGTTIKQAVAEALKMVPRDSRHGPVVVLDNCAAMGITSATLGAELGSANAVAFFTSGTASDHYDPTAVGDFSIADGQTVPSSC